MDGIDQAMDRPAMVVRRVERLEWRMDPLEHQAADVVRRVEAIEKADAAVAQQLIDIKGDVVRLENTINKLFWAIVGLTFAILTSAAGVTIQQIIGGGGTP